MSKKLLQVFTLAIATLLAACSPIKVLNALTPTSTFTKTSAIAYGDDPRQKLDIYRPVTALPDAPVVVFSMAAAGTAAQGMTTVSSAKPWPRAASWW